MQMRVVLVLALFAAAHAVPMSYNEMFGKDGGGTGGKKWALIIAGSNTWGNYRHQADAYHAYQIMKKGGLSDDNIVMMHYDDIAASSENPHKGTVINRPGGPDVYEGVPKDYTGAAVTAENFLAVLKGDKSGVNGGSGKVIDSGKDDQVFVYYVDHGGPGILGMPEGESFLYGKDVVAALKSKHAANGYKQLVFYIEACESGSIFDGTLPKDINVYATTASNPNESSWGCYCPGMKSPPPAGYNTCLGDLYSVAWMEDTDANNRATESFEEQYRHVKLRTGQNGTYTEGSHVMQYGDLKFDGEDLDKFYGDVKGGSGELIAPHVGEVGAVDNRDAELLWLQRTGRRVQLARALAARAAMDTKVAAVASAVAGTAAEAMRTTVASPVVNDWDCFKASVGAYEAACGRLGNYGMKHARTLANFCNAGFSPRDVAAAGEQVC